MTTSFEKSLGRNNGRINDPNFFTATNDSPFYYGWLSIKWQESWVIAVHEKKEIIYQEIKQ